MSEQDPQQFGRPETPPVKPSWHLAFDRQTILSSANRPSIWTRISGALDFLRPEKGGFDPDVLPDIEGDEIHDNDLLPDPEVIVRYHPRKRY